MTDSDPGPHGAYAVSVVVVAVLLLLAMLGVLLWLLHRHAAPGALLAVFLVLEPATKLLLEPLRATPRPPLLMVGIPATILVGTLLVLAATRVVRGRGRPDVAVRGTAGVRA